jgi:phospholipid/cholesterol/gamma-HCH transport system substrate-binding protein
VIRTGVKLQLLAFLIITVLGCTYLSVRYIGLGADLFNRRYTVKLDLADSGGIFTNAEVTYRGVSVGRVGPLHLTEKGVIADLLMDAGTRVPTRTQAVVANRSAIGEQYVDLQPSVDKGPYLHAGSVIPQSATHLPVSTADLLRNVDSLVKSVPTRDLGTVLDELNKGFNGSGPDLQRLIDSGNNLVDTANKTYPDTQSLLHNGRTVLDTAVRHGGELKSFSHNLASLTDELRRDDPDIRGDLDSALPALNEGNEAINDLSPTLPVVLGNLTTVGQVTSARIPGIRQILVTYPIAVAGAYTALPDDGTLHLGLELHENAPVPCEKGYEKTNIRYPQDTTTQKANTDAYCKQPPGSDISPRGARKAPSPGPTPQVPYAPKPTWNPWPSTTPSASPSPSQTPTTQASPPTAQQSPRPQEQPTGNPGDLSTQRPDSSKSAKSVYMAAYDPATNVVHGPNGEQFILGSTGGQQRILGDESWKWLLMSPLAGQ